MSNEDEWSAKLDRLILGKPDGDTMRIMMASDVHLGYAEMDPIRAKDSFNAFEEVLKLANQTHADMILLGGDLFHESRPSRASMLDCIRLLRKHTYGQRPSRLQYKSDETRDFSHSHFPTPNYLDPNCNVKMPVFSVSGNHDDITGSESLSVLDELQETKMLNYFGKVVQLDNIEISPIILQVGSAKLALYGLNSLKDERLHRCFKGNQVKFLRQEGDPIESSDFFNLFVIHQNRVPRGSPINCIPEQMLPGFIDFVLWGHEHDAQPEPVPFGMDTEEKYILQPGSTVATSLAEGEQGPKYCYMLEVKAIDGKQVAKCTPIKLKTCRQLMFKTTSLDQMDILPNHPALGDAVERFCENEVRYMIDKCRTEREKENNPKRPHLPLIRLRVEYSDSYQSFKKPIESRFCQVFEKEVANPREIFKFSKKVTQKARKAKIDPNAMQEAAVKNKEELQHTVENIVKEYFDAIDPEDRHHMNILSEGFMRVAVTHCVSKGEKTAPANFIRTQRLRMRDKLKKDLKPSCEEELTEEDVNEAITNLRMERLRRNAEKGKDADNEEHNEAERAVASFINSKVDEIDTSMDLDYNDVEAMVDQQMEEQPSASRGRGRGRGRGTAKSKASSNDENNHSVTRGRGRGRGSRGSKSTQRGSSAQRSIADTFASASKRARPHSDDDDSSATGFQASNSNYTSVPPRSKRNTTVGASYLDSDSE